MERLFYGTLKLFTSTHTNEMLLGLVPSDQPHATTELIQVYYKNTTLYLTFNKCQTLTHLTFLMFAVLNTKFISLGKKPLMVQKFHNCSLFIILLKEYMCFRIIL